MFSAELELTISPESVRRYKDLAYKHLDKQNCTVSVACAGQDADGNDIFGIRLALAGGKEEWYDLNNNSSTLSSALLGWNDKEDANLELENKVLPQIGYAVHQKDLQLFHKCMGEIKFEL